MTVALFPIDCHVQIPSRASSLYPGLAARQQAWQWAGVCGRQPAGLCLTPAYSTTTRLHPRAHRTHCVDLWLTMPWDRTALAWWLEPKPTAAPFGSPAWVHGPSSQAHQQRARSEVQQPGLKPVPTCPLPATLRIALLSLRVPGAKVTSSFSDIFSICCFLQMLCVKALSWLYLLGTRVDPTNAPELHHVRGTAHCTLWEQPQQVSMSWRDFIFLQGWGTRSPHSPPLPPKTAPWAE